jgi:PTH1 family peptidyl-tRNA hydrolase
MAEQTYLIIGLGNPGREHRDNRHNVGFMLIDRLAVRLDARGMKLQSKALITSALHADRKLLLAKPQTYMNLSGHSVQGLLSFYKLEMERLIVAHDDLDLPFGALRIRPGGGPGGQRGMASTIENLGTKEFPRLRIGIGRPPGRMDPKNYVLQDFSRGEREELSAILDRAADAALTFVTDGLDRAMNKYNAQAADE